MRIRTAYSFRAAVGHLEEVISRLQEVGLGCAPISDRNSTFAFASWNKLAKAAGLRPIYGVELGVVPELCEKRPTIDYWTFFAKDNLRTLHDAIAMATGNPGSTPALRYKEAASLDLIKITGPRVQLDALQPDPNTFIGLAPSTPRGLLRRAIAAGHRLMAASDNAYPRADDKEFYRVTLGRTADTQSYPQHILSREEWMTACEWLAPPEVLEQAWVNQNVIIDNCTAQLQRATLLVPEKEFTLEQMCVAGAQRLGVDLTNNVYAARLARELEMIASKKFEDYFYIIADMIAWAKERMIVGPARGSSCGSLVCYLLGITAIDPIPFDLIFERFIDVNRTDLPDIDIDFSDVKREEVFKYVEEKYGRDRVARLGTVGMYKPRSAMKQAGSVLRVPGWKINRVLDVIVHRFSGDSRAMQTMEDALQDTEAGRLLATDHPEIRIATRMEGHPNNASQHAAGIVLTEDAVKNYVAVDERSWTTMCDKYDAEDFNLLKIDALGLTQLSIFERCLRMIGAPDNSAAGWLEKLPLDDQAAFDVLNAQRWSGIFQFAGGALQSIAKQIKIDKLEDIISITALARPGPMASGGAMTWIGRRIGTDPITYPHPLFEPYLRNTLGVVIYQETVLQIGREIGDLSWEDVTQLRKSMSKSLGKEYFDQWGDRWKAGAAAKGIPANVLEKTWDDLCAYGSWAFNRSHSVAYGIVSYYCCYLKAHYPLEFAAATLDAEGVPMNQIKMLRELKEEGIDYVPIDPEHSSDCWSVAERNGKRVLVGPLSNVKGIGPAHMQTILDCRKTGKEVSGHLQKLLASGKTAIDTIYPVQAAITRLHNDDLSPLGINMKVTSVKDVQCGVSGQVLIIAIARKIAPKDENEQINVAKRGGRVLSGPTQSLNLFFADDTDEIFCKVNRWRYEALGKPIVEYGRPDKAIYAIRGTVPADFRMIWVDDVWYLGDIDADTFVDPFKEKRKVSYKSADERNAAIFEALGKKKPAQRDKVPDLAATRQKAPDLFDRLNSSNTGTGWE